MNKLLLTLLLALVSISSTDNIFAQAMTGDEATVTLNNGNKEKVIES